ncbi:hypothetical protein R3P38DRAFT_2780502 [Favolaschia claudopus]|uniref:Uncharacterized protein n=1 Tax=Favolaschia claudopus TaxID=2862362 RepID=A0AAW0B8U8_9AGAR
MYECRSSSTPSIASTTFILARTRRHPHGAPPGPIVDSDEPPPPFWPVNMATRRSTRASTSKKTSATRNRKATTKAPATRKTRSKTVDGMEVVVEEQDSSASEGEESGSEEEEEEEEEEDQVMSPVDIGDKIPAADPVPQDEAPDASPDGAPPGDALPATPVPEPDPPASPNSSKAAAEQLLDRSRSPTPTGWQHPSRAPSLPVEFPHFHSSIVRPPSDHHSNIGSTPSSPGFPPVPPLPPLPPSSPEAVPAHLLALFPTRPPTPTDTPPANVNAVPPNATDVDPPPRDIEEEQEGEMKLIDKKEADLILNEYLPTHKERHPEVVQPPPKPRAKFVGPATAEQNAQTLKRKLKRDAKAEAQEQVDLVHAHVRDEARRIAAETGLAEKDVRDMMSGVTDLHNFRYNEFLAKVWARGMEWNEGKEKGHRLHLEQIRTRVQDEPDGTWSAAQLADLKVRYLKHREEEECGARVSNAAAAADVTSTGQKLFAEMKKMEKRSGGASFLVVAGSNANDTITPALLTTPESARFVTEVLKMPGDMLPQLFRSWLTGGKVVKEAKELKGQNLRAWVTAQIRDGLNRMFGTNSTAMNWTNYEERTQAGMGVRLKGWPSDRAWGALSNQGSGGSEFIQDLQKGLLSGEVQWVDIPEDEHKKLLQKYPKQEKNWENWRKKREIVRAAEAKVAGPSGSGSKRKAEEEADGGKKKKKSKKLVEAVEDDEGDQPMEGVEAVEGSGKKDKGKGKAVENEDGEKKKRKKKKKTKAVEEDDADKGEEEADGEAEKKKKKKKKKKAVEEDAVSGEEGGDGKGKGKGKSKVPTSTEFVNSEDERDDDPDANKSGGEDNTSIPARSPSPPYEREPTPDLADPNLSYVNREWFKRRREKEKREDEERESLGMSVKEYREWQKSEGLRKAAAAAKPRAAKAKPTKKKTPPLRDIDENEYNPDDSAASSDS